MGAWFRLKASFDISAFSATNQVILRALKKHGMVLADNGSPFFMSGVPDPGWNDSGPERPEDDPGLGVRGGRRLVAEGVEHVLRRERRHAASAPASAAGRARGEPRLRDEPRRLVGRERRHDAHSDVRGRPRRLVLGRVEARPQLGDAMLDDAPNTVASTAAGATYAASAWVRAPSGRTVTLRVRELSGGTVVRTKLATATATGSWQLLPVTSDAASGGTSLGVEVVVTFSGRSKSYVDDVSLART